jgi:hypothetical protein
MAFNEALLVAVPCLPLPVLPPPLPPSEVGIDAATATGGGGGGGGTFRALPWPPTPPEASRFLLALIRLAAWETVALRRSVRV